MLDAVTALGPPLFKAVAGYANKQADLADAAEARRFQAKQANRALVAQGMLQGATIAAPLVFQAWQERRHRNVAQWATEDGFALAPPSPLAGERGQQPHDRAHGWPPRGYPIDGEPGSLKEDLDLLGVQARNTPLILLVPAPAPAADERWGAGLLRRVYADLVAYQGTGNLVVRTADRAFQWPHALFHREDLGDRPTIVLQMTADRERLDIQVAGCHLGPLPGCAPFAQRNAFALRLPRLDDWDPLEVAEINRTAGHGHYHLPVPDDPETLSDINHELAARVATLCAIAALDCHHIMATPGYDELLDEAVARAGVVADDWPEDCLLPLGFVADPAYHALHCCGRLLRRGKTGPAQAELRLALTLLAGLEPGTDSSDAARMSPAGLGNLVALAAGGAFIHAKHHAKLLDLLPEFDPSGSLSGLLAEARARSRDAAQLDDRDHRELVTYRTDRLSLAQIRTINAPNAVQAVAFSPDATHLALACSGQTILITDISGEQRLEIAYGSMRRTGSVFSGAGSLLDAKFMSYFTHDLAYNLDGSRLATAGDFRASIWDTASGKEILTFNHGRLRVVNGVAFSPDGRRIATVGTDSTARVWDASTGEELVIFRHPNPNNNVKPAMRVVFHPDGQRIASTSSTDGTVRIWESVTGNQLHEFVVGAVRKIAFSSDGERLAMACGGSGTAEVWDAGTGEKLLTVTHDRAINWVAFSCDGMLLATASNDRTGRVWDAATGKQLLTAAHANAVNGVAFSRDGTSLATASNDRTVQLWRLNEADWA